MTSEIILTEGIKTRRSSRNQACEKNKNDLITPIYHSQQLSPSLEIPQMHSNKQQHQYNRQSKDSTDTPQQSLQKSIDAEQLPIELSHEQLSNLEKDIHITFGNQATTLHLTPNRNTSRICADKTAEGSLEYLMDVNPLKKEESWCSISQPLFNTHPKSYRKKPRKQIYSIPYRKCYQILQGRIVAILNKIMTGKVCSKDLISLTEKVHKISPKDQYNQFIISGIAVIIEQVRKSYPQEDDLIDKLETQFKSLKAKIREDKLKFSEIEPSFSDDDEIDEINYFLKKEKGKVIRRIYRTFRTRYPQQSSQKLRQIALHYYQQHFQKKQLNWINCVQLLKTTTITQ